MAWDCRIFQSCFITSVIFRATRIFIFLLCFHALVQAEFSFSCQEIKDCHCFKPDAETFSVSCPKHTGFELETFDKITAEVHQKNSTVGSLKLTCGRETQSFEWNLLKELNLNKASRNFTITELLIDSCSITVPSNQSVAELLNFFQIDPQDVQYMRYSSYARLPEEVDTFPDYMFPPMPNLEYLNIGLNYLRLLPNLAQFPNLMTLDAKSNKIVNISRDTFLATPKLKQLLLNFNAIGYIEDQAFPAALSELWLNSNQVQRVTNNTFSNLVNLKTLLLSSNQFLEFAPYAFSPLDKLSVLRLDSTKLTFYPVLDNLPSLRNFSMSYNGPRKETNYAGNENGSGSGNTAEEWEEFSGEINNVTSLVKLELIRNGLKAMPKLTFVPKLIEYYLQENNIRVVPEGAFAQLPALKVLDLSRNEISILFPIEAPELEQLNLNWNRIGSLNDTVFKHLGKLKKLWLSNNQITHIANFAFENVGHLEELDLSYNRITFANAVEHYSPIRRCANLLKLNISHNEIAYIPEDFRLFNRLSVIDMGYNRIEYLEATSLSFLQTNITLSLEHNLIERIIFNQFEALISVDVYSNMTVDLGGNPIICDCKLLALKLMNFKNIEIRTDNVVCNGPTHPLNLTSVKFATVAPEDLKCQVNESFGCPGPCECWRQPYGMANSSAVITVDCRRKLDLVEDAVRLPKIDQLVVKGYFPDFKEYDVVLDLSDNNISSVPEEFVKGLPQIVRTVDLRRNRLRSLQFLSAMGGNNRTRFNLSENLFSCEDCHFLAHTRSQLSRIYDSEFLTCMEVSNPSVFDESISKKALEYPFEDMCANPQFAFVWIPCVLLFLFFICVLLYFRYGWAMRAYLYSKGFCFFLCDGTFEEDEEKLYDAFVSFSHGDESWVLENLVNPLEADQGFKLCLHFRDWVPGDWIPDQIVRSVDQSRRTVVVLSKNFVDSIWSRLEFKAAHSRALSDRTNRLILILKGEDLTEKDVQDDDLRVYMKMNTYIKWNDPWFWHKLKYALPHRRASSSDRRAQFEQNQQRDRALQLEKLKKKMENHVVAT